jgi:hypothetical protein
MTARDSPHDPRDPGLHTPYARTSILHPSSNILPNRAAAIAVEFRTEVRDAPDTGLPHTPRARSSGTKLFDAAMESMGIANQLDETNDSCGGERDREKRPARLMDPYAVEDSKTKMLSSCIHACTMGRGACMHACMLSPSQPALSSGLYRKYLQAQSKYRPMRGRMHACVRGQAVIMSFKSPS